MQAQRADVFDPDRFFADCQAALAESAPEKAVRQVVERAVADPAAVLRGLGEPTRAGLTALHRSAELTILNVVWAPRMTLMPHDHRMWAVIGIYTGREDNIFWRRTKDGGGGKIEAAGARAIGDREAVPLGRDIIHSVTNPIPRLTGAIHVYGGEFFTTPRSEWDPETLLEQPYNVEHALRTFEEANAAQTGRRPT
jgi:predicted metal-dependent enzyme (double-stranded beta helix superfamily)